MRSHEWNQSTQLVAYHLIPTWPHERYCVAISSFVQQFIRTKKEAEKRPITGPFMESTSRRSISLATWSRHQMETFSAWLAICAGNSPVNSARKGQWRGALMFSLICVWINGWVNNREAGDLRRYRAHYDVTVMGLPVTRKRFHVMTSTYDEWKTPAVSASRLEYFECSARKVRIVNLKGGPAIPISEGPISPGIFLVKPITSKHR